MALLLKSNGLRKKQAVLTLEILLLTKPKKIFVFKEKKKKSP